MGEDVLLGGAGVYVLEVADLFALGVVLDFCELPPEMHIDSSLLALLESNFVGVGELVDPLVGREVGDSSGGAGKTLNLILSQERFVVKCPEISSLALVGSLWRVAEHVSVSVVPAVVVVLAAPVLVIEDVHVAVFLLWQFLQILQTLNFIVSVIEAWSNHQGFVGVLSAIGENNLILVGLVLDDFGANISSGPGIDLGADGAGFQLSFIDVTVAHTKVGSGHELFDISSDQGHLVVDTLGLHELSDGSHIHSA